ncbi:hypothetical protein SAMN05444414_11358 [Roseovarius marisflavi]|uniref:Uncharacterized protein n=1 Tax=Roseovarius marisflavi TaxID=1054996 RepID=A0A1M7AF01_9RHOB|nr:hypothetical protein [Roseovarius marisflavi]SHL41312.1 hypothetical protein SAMN05444414_11358 [Roseovarius marisflavi]
MNSLDRKRDQLAGARLKKQAADAIIANAAAALPIIDDEIAHNEWAAEAAMMKLRPFVPPAVCEKIKTSDVSGVAYLGQSCRAFGDARGGIASIAAKADGVTEGEAVKLMERRAAVVERIEQPSASLKSRCAFAG